jgi:hypothetical protein
MIKYKILPEFDSIVAYFWGRIIIDDIVDYYTRLNCDPALRQGMCELCDLNDISDFSVDLEEMKAITEGEHAMELDIELSKSALVTRISYVFGMLRIYQRLGEMLNTDIMTFRSHREALLWLERPRAVAEALDEFKATNPA